MKTIINEFSLKSGLMAILRITWVFRLNSPINNQSRFS